MKLDGLSPIERKTALSLGAVVGTRMFGLFLIMPVLSVLAEDMPGNTPEKLGLALGIYGMTQALLQIPMGRLSDRFGRKPIITIGLLLFAIGSMIAAQAETMNWLIFGRAMQGLGAVAAASMALAADLSRDSQRTKVMGFIGVSIGFSFLAAMIIGPILAPAIGLSGLFWLTAGTALFAVILLNILVSTPTRQIKTKSNLVRVRDIALRPQLLRLDISVFLGHALLTALFLALPLALRDNLQLQVVDHWKLYVPVMFASVVFMVPLIIFSERNYRNRELAIFSFLAIALVGVSLALFNMGWFGYLLVMTVFFTAFNLLEASLPSMLSRRVTSQVRGTAMGAYTTAQFFGAFIGGVVGGWALETGEWFVFVVVSALAFTAIPIMLGLRQANQSQDLLLEFDSLTDQQASHLGQAMLKLNGVADAVVIAASKQLILRLENTNKTEAYWKQQAEQLIKTNNEGNE